jgi:hypothetical protein
MVYIDLAGLAQPLFSGPAQLLWMALFGFDF